MKTIFKITILTIVILISVFFGIDHVFAAWSGSMNPKTLTVYVGGTGKVTALQTGTDVVNTLPSYTSSNTAVATVERDGTVKGIKPGTVTITGKYGSLVAGTTIVTVKDNAVWAGEMSPKTLTVYVGGTGKVTALQTGEVVVNTLPSYTSSNTAVATVDRDGTVKGIKPGTVTITGKYGSLVAGTTTVTVKANAVWTGEMSPKTLTVYVGGTGKVSARQTGDIRVKTPGYYTSSNPTIATVDPNTGVVKGIKPGTTIITGKFGKYVAGTTTVTVKSEPKWTGEMSPSTASVSVGGTIKVSARQTGDIRVKTPALYSSNNTSVATVDPNTGVVKGIKPGTATITGKFGKYVAGTTTVTVKASAVWSGEINPKNATITVDSTVKVTALQTGDIRVKTPAYYTSSNTSVATVDPNTGVVKGIKPGTATITGKFGKYVAGETTITVKDVEVWEGTMVPTNLTIIVGDSAKVTAKQTGSLKVNTLPTYYCNDTSVINIDKNGTITGLKPGTATITGRFGDLIAGNTDITVLDVSIKDEWVGMTVLEKSIIPVGETSEASIKQDGKYKIDSIVTYTSSDPSVASVDAKGVVKALKPGKAVITGKVGNNLIASEAEINVSNKSKSKLIIISSIIVLFSGLVVLIRKSKHQ